MEGRELILGEHLEKVNVSLAFWIFRDKISKTFKGLTFFDFLTIIIRLLENSPMHISSAG